MILLQNAVKIDRSYLAVTIDYDARACDDECMNKNTKFDARIILSIILEEAIDSTRSDLRKYTHHLTPAQREEVVQAAQGIMDLDALRGAID